MTTRSVLDERSPPHPSRPYSSSERFGPSNDSNRSSRTNHARRAATLVPATLAVQRAHAAFASAKLRPLRPSASAVDVLGNARNRTQRAIEGVA